MFPFPTDPLEFIKWLASPIAWGLIVTLVLERWSYFQGLTSKQKKWGAFLGFIVLAFVAVGLTHIFVAPIVFPSDPRGVSLWALGVVMQGVTSWGASQYGHSADPEKARVVGPNV